MWAGRGSPSLIPPPLSAPLPRPNPIHHRIITSAKPHRIFIVSAKFQERRSRRQNNENYNYNYYDYDYDDDDVAEDTIVSTQESFGNFNFKSEEEEEGNEQKNKKKNEQVPSGSDILRALQRATLHKQNKENKKKLRAVPDSKAKAKADSIRAVPDSHVKVKPTLRIKSDWSSRLDELEMRLQHLLHI